MKFSICIINKNSEKTIELALRSVLSQLDGNWEVVIVDESNDNSRKIILQLQKEYPKLIKTVFLDGHDRGNIGDARNRSIAEASGDYCLMNIDCDDLWEPHILDFVNVYLHIEKNYPNSFFLAGHQINMARRDFLLSIGPYQSIEHGEDRDLWMRLAKRGEYMPLDHVAFFQRMPLTKKIHKVKALKRTFWSVRDEIRGGRRLTDFIHDLFDSSYVHSVQIRIWKILFYPLALKTSRAMNKFDASLYFENVKEWNNYKSSRSGTYEKIAKIWGFPSNLDFLQNEVSRLIFKFGRSEKVYNEIIHMQNIQK